jgi:hypothetical protein
MKDDSKDRLAFIDVCAWQSQSVPVRRWIVRDRIPAENVTLLSAGRLRCHRRCDVDL